MDGFWLAGFDKPLTRPAYSLDKASSILLNFKLSRIDLFFLELWTRSDIFYYLNRSDSI